MADAILVGLLLLLIWAAVLLPPARGARASREAEFLGSIRPGGHPHDTGGATAQMEAFDPTRFRPALTANARRRQVLGGLVVALGATLLLGLLPTFRLLLVVHLLLLNSCLAYVGLLVHMRDQQAAMTRAGAAAAWRRDDAARQAPEAETDLAYAYALGTPDELGDTRAIAHPGDGYYGDERGYYAGSGGSADEDTFATAWESGYEATDESWPEESWAEESWADESSPDESWDEQVEAEAAYVDEELGLRLPA